MVSQVTAVNTTRKCDRLACRYLAAVDIEGFNSPSALEQVQMLADLCQVLDIAANRACLNRPLWQQEMRGDGEVAVLPAETESRGGRKASPRQARMRHCARKTSGSGSPDSRRKDRFPPQGHSINATPGSTANPAGVVVPGNIPFPASVHPHSRER